MKQKLKGLITHGSISKELNKKNIFLTCENRRLKEDIESPEAEEDGNIGEWFMKAIAVILALWLIYGFLVLLWTQSWDSNNQPV